MGASSTPPRRRDSEIEANAAVACAAEDLGPGDVFACPPGHDAWVVGDQPCVAVDFGEFGEYAKRN
jgi:hypothetical protein